MSVYDATSLAFAVQDETGMFHNAQGVFLRNILLEQEGALLPEIKDNAWEKRSETLRHACEISVLFIYNNKRASQLLQHAALHALPVVLRVTFPDAAVLQGRFLLTRYALQAGDQDVLAVELEARAMEALTV